MTTIEMIRMEPCGTPACRGTTGDGLTDVWRIGERMYLQICPRCGGHRSTTAKAEQSPYWEGGARHE